MIIDIRNNVSVSSKAVERSDTLTRFFNDIKRYDVLPVETEKSIFSDICTYRHDLKEMNDMLSSENDSATKESIRQQIVKLNEKLCELKDYIVQHNQRFVVAIAKKYANNDSIMDLISEGNIGLMEAVDTFDISKGAKFVSWAVFFIRRAINKYVIDTKPQVRQTNVTKTFHAKISARNKFYQEEQREPTQEELKDYINENYSINVRDSFDLIDMTMIPMDVQQTDDDQKKIESLPINTMPETLDIEENEYNKKLTESLIKKLNDAERETIKYYFGIDKDREYDMQEISTKLGLSPERIRQLKKAALSKMRVMAKAI